MQGQWDVAMNVTYTSVHTCGLLASILQTSSSVMILNWGTDKLLGLGTEPLAISGINGMLKLHKSRGVFPTASTAARL